MVNLDRTILAYQTALGNLPSQKADDSLSKVMSVLVARDGVARALSDQQPPSTETVIRLAELDERLKVAATTITAIVGHSTLVRWRETMQPPATAWWWYLDERAAAESKSHPFWTLLAGFLITLSLSLTAEISRRFLSVGPDFISVFSTLAQGVLALLAGSTFTQVGREWVENVLSTLGIKATLQHKWKAGLALTVLFIVFALWFSLPSVARFYNDQGVLLQQDGKITSAIESYQRAISLNPDYAQAHYNLATAYEEVLDYDQALSEYQIALRTDPQLHGAYNNLARLYILRRNDFASALTLLNAALNLKINFPLPEQTLVRYSLFKNRGWANLGLGYLGLAEADLGQALTLRTDGAAAHCLLAQVLEAQGKLQEALPEWEDCLRYAPGEPVEADWLGLAKERVSQGGSKW